MISPLKSKNTSTILLAISGHNRAMAPMGYLLAGEVGLPNSFPHRRRPQESLAGPHPCAPSHVPPQNMWTCLVAGPAGHFMI
jgi:hypothetical protein